MGAWAGDIRFAVFFRVDFNKPLCMYGVPQNLLLISDNQPVHTARDLTAWILGNSSFSRPFSNGRLDNIGTYLVTDSQYKTKTPRSKNPHKMNILPSEVGRYSLSIRFIVKFMIIHSAEYKKIGISLRKRQDIKNNASAYASSLYPIPDTPGPRPHVSSCIAPHSL